MTVTLVCDIDGNSLKALYSEESIGNVLGHVRDTELVKCEGETGTVWVHPDTIKYVQDGRRSLPVSAAPSATALAEHASHVAGVHQ